MPLSLDEFSASDFASWRAAAEESLKGADFDKKLLTRTHEGITVRPIYTVEDAPDVSLTGGWPGQSLLGRGHRLAVSRPLVAQEMYCGMPGEFQVAACADLPRGQDALSIPLDAASRRGVDPSEAETGEVAVDGLSLACGEDLQKAFGGIDPAETQILIWAGATALPMTGLLAAHGGDWRGGVLGDPLTEYARTGTLPLALDDAYVEMAACVSWNASRGSRMRSVGVGAHLWADAGGSAVEETAIALATAVEYLRALAEQGVSPQTFAEQTLFSFSISPDTLMQIAKFRAARILWSRVLEGCGCEPIPAHFHARSTGFHRSKLDPHTNMLRATAEGFVGYLAGVESLTLEPFDATTRAPGEFSRRIARNIHTILAEECDFTATTDPAGGAWAVESLTNELAAKAWTLFQEMEAQGGMARSLLAGFPQKLVAKTRAKRLDAVATRREGLIGVNLFPNPAETPLEDATGFDERAAHAERAAFVEGIRQSVLPKTNRSVEAVAAAFASGATLGQVSAALPRSAPCEPQIEAVSVVRAAAGYEALRERARAYTLRHGHAPLAWLANFGPPKQHKARADFSLGFLSAGGFEVHQGAGASTPEEAAQSAHKSKAPLVVVCSTDETYPEIVPAFARALHAKRPKTTILLAGHPKGQIEALQTAGIHDFIHLRANALTLLDQLQKSLSIGT